MIFFGQLSYHTNAIQKILRWQTTCRAATAVVKSTLSINQSINQRTTWNQRM